MEKKFIIQLSASFVIGGGFIALLTFLAEKVKKEYSGLVLAFPSTIAISFFFIGWIISKNEIYNIAPSTLIPLGFSILLITIYPHIANFISKFVKNRNLEILLSLIIGISFWFLLIFPFIYIKFNNLLIGIFGYFILIIISHIILNKKNYKKTLSIKYSLKEKIIRIISTGLFMSFIVFLSKTLNSFWGGIFGIFPVALISSVIIIHKNYGINNIFPIIQNIAIGSLSLFIYILVSMLTFPKYGFIYGTLISYLISMIFTYLLFSLQKKSTN